MTNMILHSGAIGDICTECGEWIEDDDEYYAIFRDMCQHCREAIENGDYEIEDEER